MLSERPGAVRLALRVQPRSKHNRIAGLVGQALRVQVSAPPIEGAANDAVVTLLAAWLGVPRRALHIVQGQSSRDKVIEIRCEDPPALAARLRRRLAGSVDKVGGGD